MDLDELKNRFKSAISIFLKDEKDLLIRGINEETITTELKTRLKNEFNDWEWNIDHLWDDRIKDNETFQKRTMFARKKLPIDKIPKKYRDVPVEEIEKVIVPDIIFHDRDSDNHNFIVIEVKLSKNTSKSERDFDLLKLEVMTSIDLKYDWGIFLDFKTEDDYTEDQPYTIKYVTNGVWQEDQ